MTAIVAAKESVDRDQRDAQDKRGKSGGGHRPSPCDAGLRTARHPAAKVCATGGRMMTVGRRNRARAAVLVVAAACAAPWLLNGQTSGGAVAIDPDDIGGTGTSA